MKKIALFGLFLTNFSLMAQQRGCGLVEAQKAFASQDPGIYERVRRLMDAAAENTAQSANQANARPQQAPYIIPVVFHVLHTNGTENISDAQIQDEVAILTRDFRKLNQDTNDIVVPFKPLAADCNIEFRLATIDPNGNCTNGITRHYDPNTIWTIDYANYVYTWDRTKYLNIYVVRSLPGMAAYANYPGAVPAGADAVVVESQYVGSIGTSNAYVSRVLTHEVGHYLNLMHLWGSTNNPGVACGDDAVNDTPITKGFTFCSLNNTADCTPNVPENIQNYMDYAYCQRMFTIGQRTRMQNALNSPVAGRNNLWSASNLLATGVTNPLSNCAPKAEFYWSGAVICPDGAISFADQSYNAPITSWQWSSPQANSSSQQNPVLTFTASGLAQVKLKVSNAWGSDSITKPTVVVLSTTAIAAAPFSQGFEANFPTNSWIATQPAQGQGFAKIYGAGFNGFFGGWVDNYANAPKVPVSFFSPRVNLSGATSAQLSYYFAYAPRVVANSDVFKVYISTTCGSSWNLLASHSATALNTVGQPLADAFVTPQFDQWRQIQLNLSSYLGNPMVHFKFEFTPDQVVPGNNFYIDDINLNRSGTTGLEEAGGLFSDLSVSPNPFSGQLLLSGGEATNLVEAALSDLSGRNVPVQLKQQNQAMVLNTPADLADGVYFLKLSNGSQTRTIKIVKSH